MFEKVKIKLTFWYLLIIFLINVFFSLIIYSQFVKEINRFSRIEKFRIEAAPKERRIFRPFLDKEIINQFKQRVIVNLILLNSGIILISIYFSYFLAGKTLESIKKTYEEQSRFISDASHELRTPLTSLKIGLELGLKDKNLNNKGKKLLKESLEEINRLQKLTDNLLTLSRYDNFSNLYKEKISLKEMVNQSWLKIENLAKKKKIKLISDIKNYFLIGNSEKLIELFMIIFDNAIKYSFQNSKIYIYSQEKNKLLNVYIKDEGIGVDKKDLPFIFERFYRADKARSQEDKDGFGLGLSIAKKIIESHQGKINILSELNKGTTVILSFSKFSKN